MSARTGEGWYSGEIGDVRRGWTLEQNRTYYPHHHHARQLAYSNHDNSGPLKRKTVRYDMASEESTSERSHHFRHSARAREITHRGALPVTFVNRMPGDKTDTLSPGTPLLGLDPRRPSTWELYSQMLPPIFSEVPAPTSDKTSPPGRTDKEPGT
jgi:hypothetical protein